MSTIASPRDPPRRTPNSSARPSLEISRSSAVSSPVPNQSSTFSSLSPSPSPNPNQQQPLPKRSNRAALREYYNLRAAAASASASAPNSAPGTPRIDLPDSEVPPGEMDSPGFDADEFVARVAARSSLEQLLRLYTRVVGEVRALDAEKKALVYDNYSKLITATETIRKMRTNMDPLNPMASTLDPAMAQIYTQASAIRESLRATLPPPDSAAALDRDAQTRRRRTRELATTALAAPDRLRVLVSQGQLGRARAEWDAPRRLLVAWRDRGVGGVDVEECLREGDGVIRRGEEEEEEEEARRRKSGVSERTSTSTVRDARVSRDSRISRDGRQ